MKKQIVITYDIITGDVEVENQDELTHFEIAAMLAYANMLLTQDWIQRKDE
ncbi:hypothetical protein WMW72_12235 [Paenibacillus filicis]|uniref:Uncharacterized protein n=1 Tax=Paenibacillus filicis TaxID=669464 RepID=A0ABU9DII3_9BACL